MSRAEAALMRPQQPRLIVRILPVPCLPLTRHIMDPRLARVILQQRRPPSEKRTDPGEYDPLWSSSESRALAPRSPEASPRLLNRDDHRIPQL